MANPFTIRIYVPEGDPDGVQIIDRLSSTGIFFTFPRAKWQEIKQREELLQSGVYVLSGYSNPDNELPTIYVGQADVVKDRIEQHVKKKDFWNKAVVFVSTNKINSTHAKWLEYALIKQAQTANRSILDNNNNPQEPSISESEKADMKVFLDEIYQTLPLVGLNAFENPKAVATPEANTKQSEHYKNTIVVPAQKEGFEETFIGENAWYAIRIAGGMLEKIQYVAAYQTAPISAVTHIAPVDRIEPYGEEGKYKLVFSEPAKELQNPIPLGDSRKGTMQGPMYTNYKKIEKAQKVSDLFIR